MNKNLSNKLALKAARVLDLQNNNPHFRAHSLGRSAYQLIGGSYGVTINPFPDDAVTHSHREFRLGFNFERKIAPKPVTKQRVPVVNFRGYPVKMRRDAAC